MRNVRESCLTDELEVSWEVQNFNGKWRRLTKGQVK